MWYCTICSVWAVNEANEQTGQTSGVAENVLTNSLYFPHLCCSFGFNLHWLSPLPLPFRLKSLQAQNWLWSIRGKRMLCDGNYGNGACSTTAASSYPCSQGKVNHPWCEAREFIATCDFTSCTLQLAPAAHHLEDEQITVISLWSW